MTRAHWLVALAIVVVSLSAGCSSGPDQSAADTGTDGGAVGDGGHVDAGRGDAGPARDAAIDTGAPRSDGGAGNDAGSSGTDAGGAIDGGSTGTDAASDVDTGTPSADAGSDAGGGNDAGRADGGRPDAGSDAGSSMPRCSGSQEMCPCATGWYCAPRGSFCINPASPCP